MRTTGGELCALFLTIWLAGCAGAGTGAAPMMGEDDDELMACDPEGCQDYCRQARCMFPGDLDGADCRRHCQENCGNSFFDDDDAAMMACVENAGVSVICDDTEACCAEHFTSELCP